MLQCVRTFTDEFARPACCLVTCLDSADALKLMRFALEGTLAIGDQGCCVGVASGSWGCLGGNELNNTALSANDGEDIVSKRRWCCSLCNIE